MNLASDRRAALDAAADLHDQRGQHARGQTCVAPPQSPMTEMAVHAGVASTSARESVARAYKWPHGLNERLRRGRESAAMSARKVCVISVKSQSTDTLEPDRSKSRGAVTADGQTLASTH